MASKMSIKGEIELKALQGKIDMWAAKNPEAVRKALDQGTIVLERQVLTNMRRQLRSRTGKLFRGLRRLVTLTAGRVNAAVFVEKSQHTKAQAHEAGAFIHSPGGTPYFRTRAGQTIFVSRDKPWAANLPRTKPHTIRLPKRPSFQPALRKRQKEIVRMILTRLVREFERSHG